MKKKHINHPEYKMVHTNLSPKEYFKMALMLNDEQINRLLEEGITISSNNSLKEFSPNSDLVGYTIAKKKGETKQQKKGNVILPKVLGNEIALSYAREDLNKLTESAHVLNTLKKFKLSNPNITDERFNFELKQEINKAKKVQSINRRTRLYGNPKEALDKTEIK